MVLTDGSNPVTLPPPSFGYTTEIKMAIVYSKRFDGSYGVKDIGAAYDRRICKRLKFILTEAEMSSLSSLLSDPSKGRGNDIELQLGPNATGFFPFGPDLGDKSTFTIRVMISEGGFRLVPYHRFEVELLLYYLSGPASTYTISDTVDDGTLQIGTITGIGYPQDGYSPQIRYAINEGYLSGATVEEMDFGTNADKYESQTILYGRYSKMGALIRYFTSSARASNIAVVFPSNSYPFGRAKGASGSITIQPLYSRIDSGSDTATINIEHYAHNYFSMPFVMRWVS